MEKSAINQRFTNAVIFLVSQKIADSKTNIAEKLKISKSKFSEILSNRMNVGSDTLALFSIEYGVSTEWLLTGKGSMLREDLGDKSITHSITENGNNSNIIAGSGHVNVGSGSTKAQKASIIPSSDNSLLSQLAEKDNQISNLIERLTESQTQITILLEQQGKLMDQQSKLISKL